MSLNGLVTDSQAMMKETCPTDGCGLEYFIPRHIYEQARLLGSEGWVWCPNGHRWRYMESEADKQKKRVDELQQRLATVLGEAASARSRLTVAQRQVAYWKGRARQKAKAGR